ncbi:hypothetical protein Tco_1142103 [Tanacetum coccineum]
MSNTNTNLQTQTSNALHNAIMEAGGKDLPPMLASGNYNPPYKFKWTEKTIPIAEGSSKTTIEGYMENYKNVSQDIRDQLNTEAEAIQIILTGIDNDMYSIVDACPNACKMWKAIERFYKMMNELVRNQCDVTNHQLNVQFLLQLQPEWQRNRGKAIVNSPPPTYDQEPKMVAEDDALSKEKEIDKLMVLISLSFKKIYKPTNNNLRTSSNTSKANQDNSPRINRTLGMIIKARECQKPKRAKDAAYHKEKTLLYQELEAHYLYMTQIQEVTLDVADNSGPIFDADLLKKVQNDDNYNVFANDREHPGQPESVNVTYLKEQGDTNITTDTNITIDSLDMSTNGETVDQDDDDLAIERDLLSSLIDKLKCKIDDNKNRNKFLESSNKTLVDKLKGEIEDFKNRNKSLESSYNHFKEANNELSKTNQLMFKDLKKFQDELEKRHDVNYISKVELECAKAKTKLMSCKTESQKSINNYSYQINDLNQKISDMKKELIAHQEIIAIMSQQKRIKRRLTKLVKKKNLKKSLRWKIKSSFVKPEFLKKAQRANPRLYDIGCYNDNLALMLAPESNKMIRLAQESRSKLSDLIF